MMADSETHRLMKSTTLGSNLMRLREGRSFTDTTITCQNVSLSAHRCVLAAGSEFFRLLFLQASDKCATFNLSDHINNPNTFESVIDFLYSGTISISLDNLSHIAELADYLAISDLCTLCEEFLCQVLTADNCLQVYLSLVKPKLASQADGQSVNEEDTLLQMVWEVLEGRFYNHVLQQDQILEVSTEDMLHLMSRGVLKHFSIQKVLDFLLRWLQHRPNEGEVVDLFLSLVLERVQLASQLHHDAADVGPTVLSGLDLLQTALQVCTLPDDLHLAITAKLNALTDLVQSSIVGTSAESEGVVTVDAEADCPDQTEAENECEKLTEASIDMSVDHKNTSTEEGESQMEMSEASLVGEEDGCSSGAVIVEKTNTVEDIDVRDIDDRALSVSESDQQGLLSDGNEGVQLGANAGEYIEGHSGAFVDAGKIVISTDNSTVLVTDTDSGTVKNDAGSVGELASNLEPNLVSEAADLDDISKEAPTADGEKAVKEGEDDEVRQGSETAANQPGANKIEDVTAMIKVERTGALSGSEEEVESDILVKDTDEDSPVRSQSLLGGMMMKNLNLKSVSADSVMQRVSVCLQEQQLYTVMKRPRGRPPSSGYHTISTRARKSVEASKIRKMGNSAEGIGSKVTRTHRQSAKRKFKEEKETEAYTGVSKLKKKGAVGQGRGKGSSKRLKEVKKEVEEEAEEDSREREVVISEEEEKKLLMKNLYLRSEVTDEVTAASEEIPEDEDEEEAELEMNDDSDTDWSSPRKNKQKSRQGKQYMCVLCLKVFKTSYSLKRHRLVHGGKKEYHCVVCGMLFGRGYHLLRHLRSVHANLDVFTCNICAKNLIEPKAVVAHCRDHINARKGKTEKDEKVKEETVEDEEAETSGTLDELGSQYTEMEDEEGNKSYNCDICKAVFQTSELVQSHLAKHVDEQDSQCIECDKQFDNNTQLKEHTKDVHNTEPSSYTCDKCQKTYTIRSKFLIHVRACQKGFNCEKCSASFHTQYHLTRHLAVHSSVRSHNCEHCTKSFKTMQKMREHVRREHESTPEARVVVCELCGMVLKDIKYLRRHLDTHKGIKLHQCQVCFKSYTQATGLQVHMRIHTGSKPFQCEICSMLFSVKSNLMRHQRRHRGDRRHKCDQCGKGFVMMSDLKRHYTMHTGEKNYPCRFCGKCFSTKSKLPQHERIHTGERPYECRVCHKRFTQNGDRKRHEVTHGSSAPVPYKPRMSLFEIANGTSEFDEKEASSDNTRSEDGASKVIVDSSLDQGQMVMPMATEGLDEKTAEEMTRAVAGHPLLQLPEAAAMLAKYSFPHSQYY